MDLERIKKFAERELQGYQIAKAVTEVKNEVEDRKQGRDAVMSDYFKTLREPLLEQQKKTDEKQDAVIEQLRQNQLALVQGIGELAQIEGFEGEKGATASSSTKSPFRVDFDVYKGISEKEKEVFNKYKLTRLETLLWLPSDKIEEAKKAYSEIRKNKIGNKLYQLRQKENKKGLTPEERDSLETLEVEADSFDKYRDKLNLILKGKKEVMVTPQKGTGLRKYKQPRRNAFKIQNNHYGGLLIDIPKLFNEMKLNVFRGGKLIYQADADK